MIADLYDSGGLPLKRGFRTFDEFPKKSQCPYCYTNDNKPCVLVPLAGQDLTLPNIKTIPIHCSCIENNWVYAKDLGMMIVVGP